VQAGEPVQIEFRTDQDLSEPSFLVQSVQAAAQRVGGASAAAQAASILYTSTGATFASDADQAAFEGAVYAAANQMWDAPPAAVAYSETANSSSGRSGFGQSVPGMGSMYVMFTVLAGAAVLIQERKNWTLQRLITMPVSRAQLLGGKMLARIGLGMIQYAVAFGVGLALGVNLGDSPLGLLLLMVAFAICISALAFLLATLVDTEQQASGVMTFMALTLAPLGGAWWPLEIVPQFMRLIGHISPVAWVMDGFSELIFYNGTLTDVLLPVAVLLAMAAALFGAGVMRFRYE
jgi:ABC-2 type transport system permease protein